MDEGKSEVGLIVKALRLCLEKQMLIWEGAGLLVGFVVFNLLANVGLLPASKWFVFPPFLLMGLFVLYICIAVGNTASIILMRKGSSSLAEWTDVIPADKKFVHTIAVSAFFFVIAGVLIILSVLISFPAKWAGPSWLGWFSLPVVALSLVGIAAMFQGIFLFPAFVATEVEESGSFERFIKFLQANWARLLRFEGLFLGIAILLSLPQGVIAYLAYFFLASLAESLQDPTSTQTLWNGFAGLLTMTLAIGPLYAMCALIPVSFLTAACYLFCRETASREAEEE